MTCAVCGVVCTARTNMVSGLCPMCHAEQQTDYGGICLDCHTCMVCDAEFHDAKHPAMCLNCYFDTAVMVGDIREFELLRCQLVSQYAPRG